MIVRKSEQTTYIGVLLFAAFPKFGCTPLGGDPAGVLDIRSGVSLSRIQDMTDLCFDIHTTRSTDAGGRESALEL